MFEKETEEWVENNLHSTEEDYIKAFKDGAEFGYNKGYHDAEEHYMNVIDSQHKLVEESKANEWHFVSKEGFPSKDDIYLIIRNDGLHLGDYCCGGDGDIDCQSWCDYPSEEEIQDDSVIAWKEIVLPKESE